VRDTGKINNDEVTSITILEHSPLNGEISPHGSALNPSVTLAPGLVSKTNMRGGQQLDNTFLLSGQVGGRK
jgi:hypothetical protein